MAINFSTQDKEQLKAKGISPEKIEEQLNYFKEGFPSLHIKKPASIGDGILQIAKENRDEKISIWDNYLKSDKQVTKFVPASGAASRMFKDLFAFLESNNEEPATQFEKDFFEQIKSFAFYDRLNEACVDEYDKNIDQLVSENRYKDVLKMLLTDNGLNYGELPIGLLLFHSYDDHKRTPLEEHLVEGTMYAKDKDGNVSVHFTISPHHKELFQKLLEEKREELEKSLNATFDVSFSIQKPSTDTIAVDMDNNPFRYDGEMLFRPGGHGALIENLNDLEADIVFVKNIDNVVPDKFKEEDAKYKKMLAGILVEVQNKVFSYLEKLNSGNYSESDLQEIKDFIENDLAITTDKLAKYKDDELVEFMIQKLDRPIRVCGMVRNEGEPGGGPFIVENKDGSFSPHILEGSQIVTDEAKELAAKATHFNPVDLVCGIKCYKGNKFNLLNFIDKETGFISSKSQGGRALKALELPGLWNGAMSDWNTIFVEVPIETFNPVKTVFDLVRENHL